MLKIVVSVPRGIWLHVLWPALREGSKFVRVRIQAFLLWVSWGISPPTYDEGVKNSYLYLDLEQRLTDMTNLMYSHYSDRVQVVKEVKDILKRLKNPESMATVNVYKYIRELHQTMDQWRDN